jgi:hypothetical protein
MPRNAAMINFLVILLGKDRNLRVATISATFIIALAPRIIVGLSAPEAIGDAQKYLTVANNLLLNGCVSLSDPTGGECVPHWGGNQLPGYPAFIAAVYWLFTQDLRFLVVAQSLAVALAISYCVFTIHRCGASRLQTWSAAVVLSFSPVALPWVRFAFTESLAIALAIMILAELLNSLHFRRLRIISISLLLIAAVFVRYDAILLALPIAMAGIAIHGVARALLRGLAMCVIFSLPFGAWWLRSVNLGLASLPPSYASSNGWRVAKGYNSWWQTWITHQYQYRSVVFNSFSGSYDMIRIPSSAYSSKKEKAKVKSLLEELAAHSGRPFPKHIDDEFAGLSKIRRQAEPIQQWLALPLIRAGIMWANPFVSSGWPLSVIGSNGEDPGDSVLINLIKNNPIQMFGKAAIAGYRILVLGGCILLLIWSIRSRAGPTTFILGMTLTYVLARTAIFAQISLVENRYLISAMPFLEIGAIYGLSAWLRLRSSNIARVD